MTIICFAKFYCWLGRLVLGYDMTSFCRDADDDVVRGLPGPVGLAASGPMYISWS